MTPPADPARYKNHRFPGEIISHGVWLYYRFPLSYRDVQELLFERGIDVTHEAIRAVQEGPCDNTPFPLSHCYTSISDLHAGRRGNFPCQQESAVFPPSDVGVNQTNERKVS